MFLTTTKKLKIWSIVTQALIIIGIGHGIAFLFFFEFSFPFTLKNGSGFLFSGVENHYAVVGFTTLLGQVALILSILNKKQNRKNLFQIIGLCLLWLSIAYFVYDTTRDSYIHIAFSTSIPFAICTIITFAGKPIQRLWYRVIHN